MARKAQVRYWQRKGGGYFYMQHGRQVELALGPKDEPDGPTYRAAMKKYLSLLELGAEPEDFSVRALCNAYRAHVRTWESQRTYANFNSYCESFAALHGDVLVGKLLPRHVTEWLDSRETWGNTTKANAYSHLQMAINWGEREGYVKANPLRRKMKRPEARVRGKEALLSRATRDTLFACLASDAARLLFRALDATGARPGEMQHAKLSNLNGDTIVLPWNPKPGEYRHKTGKKTKRDRVICLPPALAAEVREHARGRGPGDYLFHTARDKPWMRSNLTAAWRYAKKQPAFKRHCKESGIDPKDVTPYCLRHTFASEFLDSGRSVKVCAALMGTSVAMLEKVYTHHQERALYDHFIGFAAGRG